RHTISDRDWSSDVCSSDLDELELEGIRRSRQSSANAELILHVLDAAEPLTDADRAFLAEFAGKKRILICNKIDLPRRWEAGALRSEERRVGKECSAVGADV